MIHDCSGGAKFGASFFEVRMRANTKAAPRRHVCATPAGDTLLVALGGGPGPRTCPAGCLCAGPVVCLGTYEYASRRTRIRSRQKLNRQNKRWNRRVRGEREGSRDHKKRLISQRLVVSSTALRRREHEANYRVCVFQNSSRREPLARPQLAPSSARAAHRDGS